MPVETPKRQNIAKRRLRTLNCAELRLLLDVTAKNPGLRDLHDVATIIANTGIRPGEISQMKWADVDISLQRFAIRSKFGRKRSVPYGPKTLQTLKARREREPEAEYLLGPSASKVLRTASLQLRAVCDDNGLHGVTFRTLRHTMFSRLMSSGASIHSLMGIAGLKDPGTMESHCSMTDEERFVIAARGQAKIEEDSL